MLPIIVALAVVCFSIFKIIPVIRALRNRTIGEIVPAFVLSAAAAFLAALVGFVGAALLCANLLSGEASEAGLILGPAAAVVLAITAFSLCFRKIITYGEISYRE